MADLFEKWQQARAFHHQGRLDLAQGLCEDILGIEPRHFEALHLRGIIAVQTNDPAKALAMFDEALSVDPMRAMPFNFRGLALMQLGRGEEALASIDQALEVDPHYAQAHFFRGQVLLDQKNLTAASESFRRATEINPNFTEAHFGCGVVAGNLRNLDEALGSYDRAIALGTRLPEVFFNRGNILGELQRWNEALASYDRAIAMKPDFAEAFMNRGIALRELGQLDDALANYDRAIAIRPDFGAAHSNRGVVLAELGFAGLALASYDRAITLDVYLAHAHANKAYLLLAQGDFEEGWIEFEWRWLSSNSGQRREFAQPLWLGQECLAGSAILLHGEHGLGDTIQFCRYTRLVAALGARVILEVPDALAGLLVNLDGVSQLVTSSAAPPPFDYHCPLMSLPLAFDTRPATIPQSISYLNSDPAKVARWRAKLARNAVPQIGLAWSGNAQHRNDRNRSIPLAELVQYLPSEFQYVNLQVDVRAPDRQVLESSSNLWDVTSELVDFTETAALCECLDLVISVDTSVAHLSAALGKATWILLPFNPDWRWLLDQDKSPWYPTVKLYRNQRIGGWAAVLQRLGNDLVEKFPRMRA